MFTLLVSWLLVACVPGLLMLVTLGLGRLERALSADTVTASDVAATIAYLLSPAGRNVSGQSIGVDANVETL